MVILRKCVLFVVVVLMVPAAVFAGGAWVPSPGSGDAQLGFSRKTADRSWDAFGGTIVHTSNHDFRYAYLSGEIGIVKHLSATYLVTFLDGFEGPRDDYERNTGLSDAWFGLKYGLRADAWPMALALTVRTPIFYDHDGPYSRYLYDRDGEIVGLNPEWRGLLKNDVTLSYLLSHSIKGGKGWFNVGTGYTWREGAPADQIPVFGEVGLPIPWRDVRVKLSAVYVQSLGNDSPRTPSDRFGSRTGYNFNDASMGRLGVSFILPFGRGGAWSAEVGYNQWVWGRSARKYDEPFLSIGRRF